MGEKIDTVFFFDNASNLPPKRVLLEMFLAQSPLWLAPPHDWLRLDYVQGAELEGAWSNGDVPSPPLSPTEILFLYSSPDNPMKRLNLLSITERDNLAVYTVTIEAEQISQRPTSEFENWLVTMYQSMQPLGVTILFSGSEIGWQEEWSTVELVRDNAPGSNLSCYWIVVDKQYIPTSYGDFHMVHSFDTFYLLRPKH